MYLGGHPVFLAKEPEQAGLAYRRRGKPCPPEHRRVSSAGKLPQRCSALYARGFPGTPSPHMAQIETRKQLLYGSCNRYTWSDKTAPARKSRACSSQKNSSTPPVLPLGKGAISRRG